MFRDYILLQYFFPETILNVNLDVKLPTSGKILFFRIQKSQKEIPMPRVLTIDNLNGPMENFEGCESGVRSC